MKILVSACLLGENCRYDGGAKPNAHVIQLAKKYEIMPICPERLGGLTIPRQPSENCSDRVVSRNGRDVTKEIVRGAKKALEIAQKNGCARAVLKQRSPPCGASQIYNGNFDGTVVPGQGVTAKLLCENGIEVLSEDQIDKMWLD